MKRKSRTEVRSFAVSITLRKVARGAQFAVFQHSEGSCDYGDFHVDLQDCCRQSDQHDAPSKRCHALSADGECACRSLACNE